jgi:hypothetical protein
MKNLMYTFLGAFLLMGIAPTESFAYGSGTTKSYNYGKANSHGDNYYQQKRAKEKRARR